MSHVENNSARKVFVAESFPFKDFLSGKFSAKNVEKEIQKKILEETNYRLGYFIRSFK